MSRLQTHTGIDPFVLPIVLGFSPLRRRHLLLPVPPPARSSLPKITPIIYVSRICVRSWGHALGLRYNRGQKFSIFQGTMLLCQQRTMLNCQQPRGTVRRNKTSHSDVFTGARFHRNGGMIQMQTNNRTIDLGAIT